MKNKGCVPYGANRILKILSTLQGVQITVVYHLAPTTIQKTKRTYIQYFTEQKIKRTE